MSSHSPLLENQNIPAWIGSIAALVLAISKLYGNILKGRKAKAKGKKKEET